MKKQAVVETLAAVWMTLVIGAAVLGMVVSIVNLIIGNYHSPSF